MQAHRTVLVTVALILSGVLVAACGDSDAAYSPSSTSSTEVSSPKAIGIALPVPIGETFRVDISGLQPKLPELKPAERADQIADWAVYAALVHAGLETRDIRAAMYDRAPFRNPALEEVLAFDHGNGRRVLHSDRSVWLFYSYYDPQPTSTLAHLIDQVRMETGEIPAKVVVLSYRSQLAEGALEVRCERVETGAEFFGPRYGYVERSIQSRADLESWLSLSDDVVHVRFENGGVILGGRRFDADRSASVSLEDVAALYRAHRQLNAEKVEHERRLEQALTDVTARLHRPYEALVDQFNKDVERFNLDNSIRVDEAVFSAKRKAVEALVGPTTVPGSVLSDADHRLEQHRAQIEDLGTKLEAAAWELASKDPAIAELGSHAPPEEPGFSLDPQWDVAGLVADLRLFAKEPETLLARAKEVLTKEGEAHAASAMPILVSAARDLIAVCDGAAAAELHPRAEVQGAVEAIIAAVDGKSGLAAENGALLPFHELLERLKSNNDPSTEMQDTRALAVLEFIQAQRRFQAARYDGPLDGTRVGMVLFYTDLVAKLWCGLDYEEEAPDDDVFGFLALPKLTSEIEAQFWEEERALPATRLWFGPRTDGYSSSRDGQELGFAHVATRVYSAGSNELKPGEETQASESSRRAFGWWDSHYEAVADFEPLYHVQNQVMKWSIVTGALVDRGVTTFLAELPVDRSLRFDTWYAASPELKCHVDVRCLPRERWTSGGEALEILQSYPFRGLGSSLVISGGVTLGGRRSIEAASKIEPTLARGLRRADVNYAESTERLIVQLRGTRVELPDVTANGIAKATTHLDDSVRLRSGASELAADEISTAVHVADARSVVSIESNIGSLGNLAYERSPALDVLSWTPGRIEIEQQLCSELAARGAYSLDDLGSAVSASDACIASEGRIVVERGANLFVVEPPDALNPGRVFRISEGAAESPGVVQAAHGSRLREMLGKDPIVRCAVEPWEAGSSAARALDDAPWAKISLLESGTAGDAPGVFRQVLTDQGPSATSRPIQISFDLPGREKLEAFVTEDGYVLVKRPEGTSGRALAELTADHLTPRQVEAMLDESVAVGQVFHVGVDSTQSVAVARQLEKDVRALRMGYRNEEAAEFWRSMSGETRDSADGLLYGALRSIEDHGLSKAATAVDRALERGGLRLDTIEAAQQMARLRGQDAIADYLLVNADMLSDVSVDVARALRLECRGYRANTVLELGSHRAESTIADFASELEVWADAPVYIEQKSDVLARYDWDALPGPSMAKVARDVNMRWSSLEIDGLGVFRPDELILDGTRFVRRGGDLGRFVGRTYVNGDSQPSGGGTIPPRDLASRLPYRGCGCSAECSCGCLSGGTCNCSHASQRDEATRRDETEPAPDSGAIEPGADAAEETDVSDPSVDGEPDELGDLFDFELPGPQPATVLLLRKAG